MKERCKDKLTFCLYYRKGYCLVNKKERQYMITCGNR
jgi:hypothetical protein